MKKSLKDYNIDIEKKWQDIWQEKNIYKWNESISKDDSFVIDTPPPTVSGSLHIGHIMSYTQTDFIARYQRMRGKNVFYPIGFDDNGLPTERLVEKTKKIRANDISREDFIKICQEVVCESEENFRNIFKSVALSIDWSQEYQTISDVSRKLSQLSFIDLVKGGSAYRKLQPTLWDPIDRTALAQADIIDIEQIGIMSEIIFKTDEYEDIIIATTRPEYLAACVAVFYNSNDDRYKHLNGKNAIIPLFGSIVPILTDDLVDMDKGTGLVMCCTFGDITDTIWWMKHNLITKTIFDKSGRFHIDNLDSRLEKLNGLKIKELKIKIIELLREENLVLKQTEINQTIKCAERSSSPLEIVLSPQWFIKLLDNKDKFIKSANDCNWYPNYMKIRIDNWINGLNWDWCISRQRYFGVPFPVWYSKRAGEEGKILIADIDQLPVDPFLDLPEGYNRDEIEPDTDVMDTWATSSISPQLNSYGINDSYNIDYNRHKKLFPADLRAQAHEIIRTWSFYTIVKSYYHENSIPWKNIMISGWCLASDKSKMSKSKGNVIIPENIIKEKGADVVRYWASTPKLGADSVYSDDIIKIAKKLTNKLWNAAKFCSIFLEKMSINPKSLDEEINLGNIYINTDLWLISNISKTIKLVEESFDKFEYCNARIAIENFFWNIFCDDYLEIIKVRIYDQEEIDHKASLSAIKTIYFVFDVILKLFAPFIPHITEEIHSIIYDDKSIHEKNSWPNLYYHNDEMIKSGDDLVSILDIIRKFKSENNMSMKTDISKITIYTDNQIDNHMIKELSNVCNSKEIIIMNKESAENCYSAELEEYLIEIEL